MALSSLPIPSFFNQIATTILFKKKGRSIPKIPHKIYNDKNQNSFLISDNLQSSEIVSQSGNFIGQCFRKESGIYLFRDIRAAMSEQPADNGHGQAFVQGKNRERMPCYMGNH